MAQYFGADQVGGKTYKLLDLQYFVTLMKSLLADLVAIKADPTKYTTAIAGIINDKKLLYMDIVNRLTDAMLQSITVPDSVNAEYTAVSSDLGANMANDAGLTPIPDATPFTLLPYQPDMASTGAYRAAMPFRSAPALPPGTWSEPATTVSAQLSKPIVTHMQSVSAETLKSVYGYTAPGAGGPAASTGKLPTVAILAAVAVGAYLMTR